MIDRACGWALWKALITYNSDEAERAENAQYTINEIIKDEKTWLNPSFFILCSILSNALITSQQKLFGCANSTK